MGASYRISICFARLCNHNRLRLGATDVSSTYSLLGSMLIYLKGSEVTKTDHLAFFFMPQTYR